MAIAIIADVLHRENLSKAGPKDWEEVLETWQYCTNLHRNPDSCASTEADTVQDAIQLSLDRLPRVSF